MSRLGGFDLCIEISRATLRRLFIKYAKIGGTTPNPPFDLVASARLSGPFGPQMTFLVPVESLELELWPGTARTSVALGFSDATLQGPGLALSGLAGTIAIEATIDLAPTQVLAMNGRAIRVDLHSADLALQLEPDSTRELEEALAAAGIALTSNEVRGRLEDACRSVVRGGVSPLFPQVHRSSGGDLVGLPVIPTFDGSLGDKNDLGYPGPRLTSFDAVICQTPDSLAAFATLLADSPGGNPAQKVETCLEAGSGLAFTFSSEVFRRLCFCPGAIKRFKKPDLDSALVGTLRYKAATELPGCCGSAEAIEYKGLPITYLCARLVDPSADPGSPPSLGHIEVNGTYRKSTFCFDASGSFSQRVDLTIDATGELSPTASSPSYSVHVFAPFYCPTAVPFLLGELFPTIRGIYEKVLEIGKDFADALGVTLPKLSIPSAQPVFFGVFEGVTFSSVATLAEGITINAGWALDLPAATSRTLELVGQVKQVGDPEAGRADTYIVADGPLCSGGSYPWTEFTVELEADYELQRSGWAEPVVVEWWLEHIRGTWGYNQQPQVTASVALDAGKHLTQIPVDVSFDAPPPRGPTLIDEPLPIPYEVKDRSVVVKSALLGGGNYSLSLRARVTDTSGASMETTTALSFHCEWVEIGGGYAEHVKECIERLRKWALHQRTIPRRVPHDGDPGPGDLVELIGQAREVRGPDAALLERDALALGDAAFGSAFREVLIRSGMQ